MDEEHVMVDGDCRSKNAHAQVEPVERASFSSCTFVCIRAMSAPTRPIDLVDL